MGILSIPVIVGAALLDSINPCVIGVLIFLLAALTRTARRKGSKFIAIGTAYIIGVYATYLLLGLGIYFALGNITDYVPRQAAVLLYKVLGIVVIGLGALELKDFFWYGKGPSLQIPAFFERRVVHWSRWLSAHVKRDGVMSLAVALAVGFLVTLVELPCTGAPYLAVIAILTQAGAGSMYALTLLLLYNLVFILPLLGMVALVYKGVSANKFESWRKKHRPLMRLMTGILLVGLGLMMYFWNSVSGLLPLF